MPVNETLHEVKSFHIPNRLKKIFFVQGERGKETILLSIGQEFIVLDIQESKDLLDAITKANMWRTSTHGHDQSEARLPFPD